MMIEQHDGVPIEDYDMRLIFDDKTIVRKVRGGVITEEKIESPEAKPLDRLEWVVTPPQ